MSMNPGVTTLPAASISSPPPAPRRRRRCGRRGCRRRQRGPRYRCRRRRRRCGSRASTLIASARSSRVALDVDLAVDEHDAVALARGRHGDLAVEDVLEHGRRIALERVAEAAAAGRDVREAVALRELVGLHRHRRQLARLAARDDDVARRRARLAAVEAVGRMVAAVGADRQRRPGCQQLVLAHVGEPAALPPRAARVGHEPVALDPQRQVGLDQLDRLVAEVGERVRDALEPVAARRARPSCRRAPRSCRTASPLLVVAAERDQRRPALAGGDHPVGHERRERAHDRVVDAVADHAAGAAGRRQHRVDDRAGRGVDVDRRHVALAVRDLAARRCRGSRSSTRRRPSRRGS